MECEFVFLISIYYTSLPILVPEFYQERTGLEIVSHAYLIKKAEHDAVVEQLKADFRARQEALKNADTTFDRGFTALVTLSRAGNKATCQFDNAYGCLTD